MNRSSFGRFWSISDYLTLGYGHHIILMMLTRPHFLAVILTFRNQWLIQASLSHGCTRLDFLNLSNIRHSILSLPEYPSDGHLEYFLRVLIDFMHEHAVPVFPVVPVHQAHVFEEGLCEGA